MVTPIREIANKHLLFSSASTLHSTMVQNPSNMNMNMDNDIIRGRSTLSSKASLRSSSISSSTSSIPYHQHMKINNDIPDIDCQEPIDCSQLSYEENIEVGNLVRMATNKFFTKKGLHVCNEAPAIKKAPKPRDKGVTNNDSNTSSSQNTINIQLPYDTN